MPANLIAQDYICGVMAVPLAMWKTVFKIVLSHHFSDTLQNCDLCQSLSGQKFHSVVAAAKCNIIDFRATIKQKDIALK